MNKIFRLTNISHILFFGLVTRLLVFYFYGDSELPNEWAKIIHNYNISGIFGYYVVENEYVANPKLAEIGDKVLPTIFMPPLYYYFIYFLQTIFDDPNNFINSIIIFQIIMSLSTVYVFYKIILILEKKSIALFITSIFAFFPINLLVPSQISSITLQIFLIINFFYFLFKFSIKKKNKFLFVFSIFSGLLILTRGEFLIFYILTLIYFLFYLKFDFKFLLISLITTIIFISPYLNRNYELFNTITLTKSFGYNLLKGNNPNLKIEGDAIFIEKTFPREKLKIKTNNRYEVNLDNFYKDKAYEFIEANPKRYILFYIKKIIAFLFFDINSTTQNYFNLLHILPKILISITSLIGGVLAMRHKGIFQYLSIFYFSNIMLFSLFFILPRYSVILLPVQIILSISTVKLFLRKLPN